MRELGSGKHLGFYKATRLPHFDEALKIQTITFRLTDALSMRRAHELSLGKPGNELEVLFGMIDPELDSGAGNCWLGVAEIAGIVEQALLHFDKERYGLLCWVVMPNHIHCIIQQYEGFPLGMIVKSWKSHTAKAANRILGRSGRFWQRDYFDRYIRNSRQLEMASRYIHYNPVAAGLCRKMEDWPWSSYRRLTEGMRVHT